MIVTADEVHRSLRGTLDLLNRRVEGLRAFDMSERGFWRSFAAIWITLPAYVTSLAMERMHLGILTADQPLFGNVALNVGVALAHVAGFLALPVAMIWIARSLRLTDRYVPFVIVTNWISAAGLLVLSVPAVLLFAGWAPPALSILFTIAFGAVVLHLQWFATKATLGVSNGLALAIVGFGVWLNLLIEAVMHRLIG
jgi:hypothetical protein